MFIGDSANLSFLQIIRRLVSLSIGRCALVDDPLSTFMVEASPEGQPNWLNATSQRAPPQVSFAEAQLLIRRYALATNCVVDLFDEDELIENLPAWIYGRWAECTIPNPIYFLVLAIGAQTSTEDKDELAGALFTHGRYLTAQSFMEDASMSTVQSYALITTYLLGACRRNAAFMYLGIAVRAAYAVGLHRKEVSASFSADECRTRERLWKVIRILDLFMSSSLGRPPSTAETRDTEEVTEDYSASTDLCAIFEKILNDVYSRRMVSTDALSNIGAHHRRWASRFFRGLATDRIEPFEVLEGGSLPNIGLLHVKEAYYWTIILLTRPFLTQSVAEHIKTTESNVPKPREACTATDSNRILVYACVDSAIRTIDLLSVLRGRDNIPKRLPFVINSIFVAALVLGLAHFGDLRQLFPLERALNTAQLLLAQFTQDAIAQRNASIVAYLRDACNAYLEKRSARDMDYQSLAVGSMFGQIHRLRSHTSTRTQSPNGGKAAGGSSRLNNNAPMGSSQTDQQIDAGVPGVSGAQQTQMILNDTNCSYLFDNEALDPGMPYPEMSPRTLWFDSYDEHTALFSTISDINGFDPGLPTYQPG